MPFSSLPVVRYYETEEPHILKMDFIDGMTLGERIQKEKYKNGVEDLITLQKTVHTYTDLPLPAFQASAVGTINSLPIDRHRKERAMRFLEEIPDTNHLLHLDFHFLNLMYADEKYYIIDWIDAKIGNPIYDFARTYVIIHEFAFRLSKKYLSLVGKGIDGFQLKKAIYVMALLRLKEQESERTLALIDSLDKELM